MSSFSVLLPVLYPVNVSRDEKRAAQAMGADKIQAEGGRGGDDGTYRSKKSRRRKRYMGGGNGWLMKEETGRVSERPEKVSRCGLLFLSTLSPLVVH